MYTKPPSYIGGRELYFPSSMKKWLEANYKSDQEKLQTANKSLSYFDIEITTIWVIFLEYNYIFL